MQAPTWYGMAPATMVFNEALVNGPVIQLANAWTNMAYIVVAVLMIALFRKDGQGKLLAFFSLAAVIVGITSFLYHASNTFFFQVFDLTSMYLLSSLLVTLSAARLIGGRNVWRNVIVFISSFFFPLSVLMLVRGKIGAVLFGVEILVVLILELMRRIFKKEKVRSRDLVIALGLFAAAFTFWALDYAGLFISPHNHFMQGHGVWHIVNSACFIFLYRFYARSRPKITGEKNHFGKAVNA